MIPPATERRFISEIEKDHYGQALRLIEAAEPRMMPEDRRRAQRTKKYIRAKLAQKGIPTW